MPDRPPPRGRGPRSPLYSAHHLRSLWDSFRAGEGVVCPADQAPLALAVDASMEMYRFVCTRCGTPSPWFESDPDGLRVRELSAGKRPVDP